MSFYSADGNDDAYRALPLLGSSPSLLPVFLPLILLTVERRSPALRAIRRGESHARHANVDLLSGFTYTLLTRTLHYVGRYALLRTFLTTAIFSPGETAKNYATVFLNCIYIYSPDGIQPRLAPLSRRNRLIFR